MTSQQIKLLEKAFSAEIEAAVSKSQLPIVQAKAACADELVAEGMIEKVCIRLGGSFPVTVEGYSLTDYGRLVYCQTVGDS
jgi:hypothetical protein